MLSQLLCVRPGVRSLQPVRACLAVLSGGRKGLRENAWNRMTCLLEEDIVQVCHRPYSQNSFSKRHSAVAHAARQRLPKARQAAESKPAKTKTDTRKRAPKKQQKQPRLSGPEEKPSIPIYIFRCLDEQTAYITPPQDACAFSSGADVHSEQKNQLKASSRPAELPPRCIDDFYLHIECIHR